MKTTIDKICPNCNNLRYIQDAGFACCSECNPNNSFYKNPNTQIISRLNQIRLDLDNSIKHIADDESMGFDHPSWSFLVSAKDSVGLAILSLTN